LFLHKGIVYIFFIERVDRTFGCVFGDNVDLRGFYDWLKYFEKRRARTEIKQIFFFPFFMKKKTNNTQNNLRQTVFGINKQLLMGLRVLVVVSNTTTIFLCFFAVYSLPGSTACLYPFWWIGFAVFMDAFFSITSIAMFVIAMNRVCSVCVSPRIRTQSEMV